MAVLTGHLLLSSAAFAGAPEQKSDTAVPESSRWSSFVRLVYGRWEVRARAPGADHASLRQLFEHCTEDAWFLAYGPMLQGALSPCGRLVRTLHPEVSDDESAPRVVKERYRNDFSMAQVSTKYSAFRDCTTAAIDHGDVSLLEICSRAMRPRERVIAAMPDTERFDIWFQSCKKVLLTEVVLPLPPGSPENLRPLQKTLTEIEKTQARHCFRNLPSLYEVQGLNKLSDFWTPEEQRALYLRSQQLGLN
jgi:hypothetical protein